jgi:hypothetical protein
MTILKDILKLAVIFIIIVALANIFTSCTTQSKCQRKFPPQIRIDSVHTIKEVIKYRDTTIYIKLAADTVFKTDTVIINKDGQAISNKLESDLEYSYAATWISNNRLQLQHRIKDTIIQRVINDAVRDRSKVETITKTETTTHEVNILKWWQIALMWCSVPTLLFLLYSVGKVVLKFFI